MSERRLLIDNDAFVLLAGASVLEETIREAGFAIAEARRLRSLEFMLRKRARAFQKYPAEVVNRALEACARIAPVELAPDAATLEVFAGIAGVDEGEAVLFGLMAEHQLHFLASNDKTAMRAVAANPKLKEIRKQIAGRVYCMELLVEKLLVSIGAGRGSATLCSAVADRKTDQHHSITGNDRTPARLSRSSSIFPRRTPP